MIKRSENDQTSDLKPFLQKWFSNVLFDQPARTERGTILKPDLQFDFNDKYYVIEAKTSPQKYEDAQIKAEKDLREIMRPVDIAFAVQWSSGNSKIRVGYIAKDGERKQNSFYSITQLADWIYDSVKNKKAIAPPNQAKMLKFLEELVDRFYVHYKRLPLDDIQEIFGGKSFFETVTSDTGAKEQEVQSLRKVAAFLLVNQIFFYGILAKKTEKYPSLEPERINDPADLQKLFDKVLEDDYAPVFGVPILKLSADGMLTADLCYCIKAINQLLAYDLSHDVLGKVFHKLIPFKLRKIVAAYYTNSEAGDLLASLAIDNPHAKVFDPACGSGTLLVSSYHRKMALLASQKFNEKAVHKQFISKEIYGSDIMPFAGHLAAINLAMQKPDLFIESLNILVEDSTTLAPGQSVESAEEKLTKAFQTALHEFGPGRKPTKSIKAGAIALKGSRLPVHLEKFDVVIMNPPFTRFQRLTPDYKARLEQHFFESKYKKLIHGQLGLHGYFLLLADRFLKDGGRIAAVLPVTTFTLKGFSEIIRYFFSNYEVEFIVAGTGRAAFSENTSLREVLFVAKKGKPKDNAKARLCFISKSPTDMDKASVQNLTDKLIKLRDSGRLFDNPDGFSREIMQSSIIEHPRNLAYMLNLPMKELQEIDDLYSKYANKSNRFNWGKLVFTQIKCSPFESNRITGKEGYYELSILPPKAIVTKGHDKWKLDKLNNNGIIAVNLSTGSSFFISNDSIMPQFRRFSGNQLISLDPVKQFVVYNTFIQVNKFLSETGSPPDLLDKIKINLSNLNLKNYFISGSGNLFLFYRGNLSAANSYTLCVTSERLTFGAGDSWVLNIEDKFRKAFACYFNSTFFFLQLLKNRRETEGAYLSIDKYSIENSLILDPSRLTEKEISLCNKLFDKICKIKLPNLEEQLQGHNTIRMDLDLLIASLLGISDSKSPKIIKTMQSSLASYINILKSTMGKS